MLENPTLREPFEAFISRSRLGHLIHFIEACQDYKCCVAVPTHASQASQYAEKIYETYMKSNDVVEDFPVIQSRCFIPFSEPLRAQIAFIINEESDVEESFPTEALFEQHVLEVLKLLSKIYYSRFSHQRSLYSLSLISFTGIHWVS